MEKQLPTGHNQYIVPNDQNKDIIKELSKKLKSFSNFNNSTHGSDKEGLSDLNTAEKNLKSSYSDENNNFDSMYTKNQYLNCLKRIREQWVEERVNKNDENVSVKSYMSEMGGNVYRKDITVKVSSMKDELKKHFDFKSHLKKASTNALLKDVFEKPNKHSITKVKMNVNFESVPMKARIVIKDDEKGLNNAEITENIKERVDYLENLLKSEENKKICCALTNQEDYSFLLEKEDLVEEHRNKMKECKEDLYMSHPKEKIETFLDLCEEISLKTMQSFNVVEKV